jgi:hypothetical protein
MGLIADLAFRCDLVFFGGKIHPAEKHETMGKPPKAPTVD